MTHLSRNINEWFYALILFPFVNEMAIFFECKFANDSMAEFSCVTCWVYFVLISLAPRWRFIVASFLNDLFSMWCLHFLYKMAVKLFDRCDRRPHSPFLPIKWIYCGCDKITIKFWFDMVSLWYSSLFVCTGFESSFLRHPSRVRIIYMTAKRHALMKFVQPVICVNLFIFSIGNVVQKTRVLVVTKGMLILFQ